MGLGVGRDHFHYLRLPWQRRGGSGGGGGGGGRGDG